MQKLVKIDHNINSFKYLNIFFYEERNFEAGPSPLPHVCATVKYYINKTKCYRVYYKCLHFFFFLYLRKYSYMPKIKFLATRIFDCTYKNNMIFQIAISNILKPFFTIPSDFYNLSFVFVYTRRCQCTRAFFTLYNN